MQAAPDPGLLLDREAELEALEAAVGAARAGQGRLVVVEGAGGQGKTALLTAARREAERAGLDVLAARGSELESEVPFGLALELFAASLQSARPPERAELFRGAAALATPLFSGATFDDEPRAAEHEPDRGAPPGPPSSFPVVHGVYWLLANLAERAAGLVAVDDAHWADVASLRFLLYLAERLEGLPVSLVVALRPEEVAPDATALARLRAAPRARVLDLHPLGKDDTVRLIRRHYFPDADGAFCRAVYDVSDGNPFILREVLAVIDLDGMPPTAESAPAVRRLAPESVVRATRTRLARLRPEAAELAEAAAVLDQDAALTRAAALAGLDDETAAAAAADLVRAGLLRGETAAGGPADLVRGGLLRGSTALEFAQPPLWSAVYSGIPPARRGALHDRAVAVLAGEDHPHPERLAAHLLHSPPAGRAESVERLRTAARRATGLGATEVAARFLRRALAEPPRADRLAEVLLELGRIGAMVGDNEAVDHFRTAVDLLPDPAARAGALGELGRALADRGRFREATGAFRQALADAGPAPSELGRRLLAAQLQATRLAPGSRDPGLLATAQAAVEAVDPGTAASDPAAGSDGGEAGDATTPGRRALLGELAFEWLLAGGRFDDVRSAAHRALAGLELPFGDGAGGLAFYNAVAALTWADDLVVAEESLDRAVAESERVGDLTAVATASFRRAVVAYLRGAVPAAVVDAQRAVDAEAFGWASYLPAARGILALALMEQGELPRAAAALVAAEAPLATPTMAIFFQARARLHLVEGAPEDALADALVAGEVMTAGLGTDTAAIVPWRSLAAIAHHELGDTAAARRLAGEEVAEARRFGAPRALGRALRVAGLVEGGSRGMTLLRESVSELAGSPARLERARALGDLGGALLRTGRDGATESLRDGLELAEAGGAVVLAEQLRGELARAGARPPRRARRRPTDLTPAEERVAQLAAGGLTNKQLAQQLFVSVRAVEFHLGNVFSKLGISSRRELPAALGARPGGGLSQTG